MDVLAAGIAAGALTLAAWGAWRPHYRAASYLVAGAVELALIGLLVVTGQTLMAIRWPSLWRWAVRWWWSTTAELNAAEVR